MRSLRTGGLMAAALMAGLGGLPTLFGGGAPAETAATAPRAGKTTPATAQRASVPEAVMRRVFGGGGAGWRPARHPNGPGWTQAQVQRRARKRRNVLRNRRTQRRAGR